MSDLDIYDDPSDMDVNGDGVTDDVTVSQHDNTTVFSADTDGDGRVDTVAVDGPDTGDGGAVDVIYYDTDGDGRVDVIDADTDGDGHLDTRYTDSNEDGQVDRVDSSDGATDHAPTAEPGSDFDLPGTDPFASS